MHDVLLRIEDAAFGYRGKPVVSGVDLALRPGTYTCIVGANGSGKTTLLRGAVGLLPPLTGRVRCRRDLLGYVPQRERLDPVFPVTVSEVVSMGAYGRLGGLRRPSREDREEARRCLAAVDLLERGDELFAALSGGQRQRALLARALLMRPELLVLDEPTSGVDEESQRLIFDLLRSRTAEHSLSVLLITHQLEMTRGADLVLRVAQGGVRPESSEDRA